MRNIINIALALVLSVASVNIATAQSNTSYFMRGAIERNEHNAAFSPDRGYFNMPFFGDISITSGGNVSVGDFIHEVNGEYWILTDPSITSEDALQRLNKGVNQLNLENRLGILGFGAYSKNSDAFWNFEIALRTSTSFAVPYELFQVVKEAPDFTSVQDVNVYMDSFAEVAVGYSRQLSDKIRLGVRLKGLVGLGSANVNISNMDLQMNANEWSLKNAHGYMDVYGGGVSLKSDPQTGEFVFEDIDIGTPSPAGYGAAIDLGLTYDFSDRLQFSFSANDLGAIAWSKDSNVHGSLKTDGFIYTGVDVDISGSTTTTDPIEFNDLTFLHEESRSSTQWLQTKINAGAEYTFFNEKLRAGAFYSAKLWRAEALHSVTIGGSFQPIEWFTLGADYTNTLGANGALGVALNFSPGWINFFIASDVLLSKKIMTYFPQDQTAMNVSFGLGIPMGRKRSDL